ncbi:apolipoprotein N-acyltransferase [Candidatus Endobugula sertula]|uniref:Apolipoprotein N-acyltransferase n=1 Tax=Candidatus Endobugula sertula TaxID=62101 RepID=A0A1D2QLT9_9GAMM|nr:apolipoprotein N-acyltransferase [Candidatus Endobugula sertula]
MLQHRQLSLLACLIAGALTPLSLSPFNLWLIGLLSLALFAIILSRCPSAKTSLLAAYIFAIGYYGTGVSWVFVSIYYFGSTSFILAIIMTILFILFVALFFALPFYAMHWFKPSLRLLLGFPLLWVFSEWLRTWILTGFPWLYIGYSHLETPLSGWAPIGGVLLIGLWSSLSSSTLALWLMRSYSLPIRIAIIGLVATLWLGGYILQSIPWTEPAGDNVSVGLVQPNIPQDQRWKPSYRNTIKQRLRELSGPLWSNDWIIWPEAAIPHLYHNSLDFIDETRALAKQHNTIVVTGVLYNDWPLNKQQPDYYNSIIGIGDAEGIYHKQRLVPFGEYVPLEHFVRGLIDFFNLPLSVISSGQSEQNNLRLGQHILANAICYEIAYPNLVANQAKGSSVLLTVSNDAWFGHSIGPIQHFQIARMRALEIGRYIIRGTNNGISAIIEPDGQIQAQTEQFVATRLEGTITPMQGTTPYMRWRDYPLLVLFVLLAAAGFRKDIGIGKITFHSE